MSEKLGNIRVNRVPESGMGTTSDKLMDRNKFLRDQKLKEKPGENEKSEEKDPKRPLKEGNIYIKA